MLTLLAGCMGPQKEQELDDDDASEIQLNVFEFRNYRTALDENQQAVLEHIVNQWCVLLVKGKSMLVNNFMEKVYIDKDLLNLEIADEEYPLKQIRAVNFFTDDLSGSPYVLEVTFDAVIGDQTLIFNFDEERVRLNFAIALRVLRSRDPTLDPSTNIEIQREDKKENAMRNMTYEEVMRAQHFHANAGLPVIVSVSDLKLFQKLQSTSRHVYLEFFVKYPAQDKFLYAKSPTTHIPSQAVQTDDMGMKAKRKKGSEEDEEEERKKEEMKKQAFGNQQIPIAAMRFDLKNVKLKIPKVPHTIFGRLMAKDDYFPTALGIFDAKIEKSMIADRRKNVAEDAKSKKGTGEDDENTGKSRKDPETMSLPVMSAWKMTVFKKDLRTGEELEEEQFVQIGTLTIRAIGYVLDQQ